MRVEAELPLSLWVHLCWGSGCVRMGGQESSEELMTQPRKAGVGLAYSCLSASCNE